MKKTLRIEIAYSKKIYFFNLFFCLVFCFIFLIFSKKSSAQSLDTLLVRLNQTQEPKNKIELLEKIGTYYKKRKIYLKSKDYFNTIIPIAQEIKDKKSERNALQEVASICLKVKDYKQARHTYQILYNFYRNENNIPEQINILENIVNICNIRENYQEALQYNNNIIELSDKIKDTDRKINALNNTGFLQKSLGNDAQMVNYFTQALELNKQQLKEAKNNNAPADKVIPLLCNLGFSYTYLKKYPDAEKQYQEALKIAKQNQLPTQEALLYNYLAANYYIKGSNAVATEYIEKAIDLGEGQKDKSVLMESYKIASEIYQKDEDFKTSQKYYKEYLSLKEIREKEAQRSQEEINKNQIQAERQENELNQILAEKQKQALQIRQFELENEKKEKELALNKQLLASLEKDKKLQAIETERQRTEAIRATQALEISRQKLVAEQNNQKITELQKQKALQDLQIQEQKLKENKDKLEKIELEKAQKEAKLQQEKEKERANFITYIFAIIGAFLLLILIIIIWSFLQKRKDNLRLKAQADAISEKNEELQTQAQEIQKAHTELQANSAFIEEANEELTKQSIAIQEQNEALEQAQSEMQIQNMLMQEQNEALEQAQSEMQIQNLLMQEKNVELESKSIQIEKANDELKINQQQLLSLNEDLLASEEEIRQNLEELNATQEQLKRNFDTLSEKNKHIQDSINYALNIQQAILPRNQDIQKTFEDFFILYKPRDVISGDFYWFADKGDKKIIIVADCTGHGVPGAFMSMLGNSLLNQIIHDREEHQANKILDFLHKGIEETLNQKQPDVKIRDGMDAVVCVINQKEKTIEFAGANNSIYFICENKPEFLVGGNEIKEIEIENSKNTFYEIKPDKISIGGRYYRIADDFGYALHKLPLNQTFQIYMFSDGYADQIGGKDSKKINSTNFKKMVIAQHEKPYSEQKAFFDTFFVQWIEDSRGYEKQLDDVTFVGLKIK